MPNCPQCGEEVDSNGLAGLCPQCLILGAFERSAGADEYRTQTSDGKRMKVEQRLELVLAACRAVQHAHHKGVIHRDLKPSNVLVMEQEGAPVPKVIDFGIAKATDQWAVEATLLTQFGQMVG